jgi:hypothetical protein
MFESLYKILLIQAKNHNISVHIAVECRLDGRGFIRVRDKTFFSTPERPDRLWDALTSYPVGTRGVVG